MAINFSGLASGIDTDSIVKQIMELERAPINRLETRKTQATERLNAFSQFKSRLDDLKSAASNLSLTSQVRTTKVSLSSEDALTANSSNAALGSYDISVGQLAQVQKTVSDGFSSNLDSILGTGKITVNGVDIAVGSTNNSLVTLAESINAVSGQTGVSVSIINDGTAADPYHMVFTGKDASTSFTVTADLRDELDAPIAFNTTQAKSAQQAVAFIDGIKVVSSTNTITDAISGVTLNLNSVSKTSYAGTEETGVDPWDWADPPVYNTATLDVTADTDTLKEKITTFVTSYNAIMEWIKSGYEEFGGKTTTSTTETTDGETKEEELLGTLLRGDATINNVKRSLQSVFTDSVKNGGKFSILSQIGISTQVDGTLRQDNSKLDAALANNFEDMVSLLSGAGTVDGVMKKFNSLLLNITSASSGMYANQKNSYNSTVKSIDAQISTYESRMTKREATLRSQYSAMEQLVSSLNAQGDYLTQQFDSLNK